MNRLMMLCASLTMVAFAARAQDDTDDTQRQILVDDLRVVESKHDYATTVDRLRDTLNQHADFKLMDDMDLAEETQGSGVELTAPTHLFVFGSPKTGTRLMQANPTAGLDLPIQLIVFERDGKAYIAYNTAEYIAARHDLKDVDETLANMDDALKKVAMSATDRDDVVPQPDPVDLSNDRGIQTMEAPGDVAQTTARLEEALKRDEDIAYVEVMDHTAMAEQAGVELSPIRLIIAGHANREVEMVNLSRTAAVDLPLKFLVYEDAADGKTYIAWNDPDYIARRHDIDSNEELLQQMASYQQSTAESAAKQVEQAKTEN